ncbi:MAG: transglycosylase SLT domain-containing protein [Myxococcota bacterium]|nr:transglycosylase SLT domain-containing protein [Myxococcota bacterium]
MVLVTEVPSVDHATEDTESPATTSVPPPQKPITEIETRELRLLDKASTLLASNEVTKALEILGQIDGEFLHDEAARPVWAWTLFEAKQYAQLLRELPPHSESPELSFLRAAALLYEGKRSDAHTALQALWRRYPTEIWGQWSLWTLAKEKRGTIYSKSERRFVLNTVPPPRFKLRARTQSIASKTLRRLSRIKLKSGLLLPEIRHALGTQYLAAEQIPDAIRLFWRAMSAKPPGDLKRAIRLNLGEAQRQRGYYRSALELFEAVAKGHTDALTEQARARAGQMAIEYRRYEDARQQFEAQLLNNPLGPNRTSALWGLGWVAWRQGQYKRAREFFANLLAADPYGPRAAAAIYWGARSAQELELREVAYAELLALTQRFPVDYYAHRADLLVREHADLFVVIPAAELPESPLDSRISHAEGLLRAGLPAKALDQSRKVLPEAYESFGPKRLDKLQAMSRKAGSPRMAARFRGIRNRRYPELSITTVKTLGANFPSYYVSLVRKAARKYGVDQDMAVALARQESAFNPKAVSSAGALGLMQLMPATAATMMGKSVTADNVDHNRVLKPQTNAHLGCRYLSKMIRAFGGTVEYALAAYNAGPTAVSRWRRRGDLPTEIFVEEIPYSETRNYVMKVLSWKRKYEFLERARAEVKRAERKNSKGSSRVATR